MRFLKESLKLIVNQVVREDSYDTIYDYDKNLNTNSNIQIPNFRL